MCARVELAFRPASRRGYCSRSPLRSFLKTAVAKVFFFAAKATRNLDYSRGIHALKGHGFSRAVTWAWRVGLQPLREFARRGGCQHRGPSVAKCGVSRGC